MFYMISSAKCSSAMGSTLHTAHCTVQCILHLNLHLNLHLHLYTFYYKLNTTHCTQHIYTEFCTFITSHCTLDSVEMRKNLKNLNGSCFILPQGVRIKMVYFFRALSVI